MSTEHELKILPRFYDAIVSGIKTFEIRCNDRDFQCGDKALLKEISEAYGTHTGRFIDCDIVYVTDFQQKPGYVVFGIANIKHGWR
jgi:hypothetical protein